MDGVDQVDGQDRGARLAMLGDLAVQPGAEIGGRLQQLLSDAPSDGRRVHAPRVERARRRMVRRPRNVLRYIFFISNLQPYFEGSSLGFS